MLFLLKAIYNIAHCLTAIELKLIIYIIYYNNKWGEYSLPIVSSYSYLGIEMEPGICI